MNSFYGSLSLLELLIKKKEYVQSVSKKLLDLRYAFKLFWYFNAIMSDLVKLVKLFRLRNDKWKGLNRHPLITIINDFDAKILTAVNIL